MYLWQNYSVLKPASSPQPTLLAIKASPESQATPTGESILQASPEPEVSKNIFKSERCGFSLEYPEDWAARETKLVPGNDNPDFHYGCVEVLAPDYKVTPPHREGFYVDILRTKKGTTFKSVVINTLDDYIKTEESIWEPPQKVSNLKDITIGDKVGKSYTSVGFEGPTIFIFSKDDFIYSVSWPTNYQGNYKNSVSSIISSIQLNY